MPGLAGAQGAFVFHARAEPFGPISSLGWLLPGHVWHLAGSRPAGSMQRKTKRPRPKVSPNRFQTSMGKPTHRVTTIAKKKTWHGTLLGKVHSGPHPRWKSNPSGMRGEGREEGGAPGATAAYTCTAAVLGGGLPATAAAPATGHRLLGAETCKSTRCSEFGPRTALILDPFCGHLPGLEKSPYLAKSQCSRCVLH
jgi:hypothetical protein